MWLGVIFDVDLAFPQAKLVVCCCTFTRMSTVVILVLVFYYSRYPQCIIQEFSAVLNYCATISKANDEA